MTSAAPNLRERAPGPGWTCLGYLSAARGTRWQCGTVLVISSIIDAELPDGSGVGLQWHVSISSMGKRPKQHQVAKALRDFGLVGAEEDNHHPGNARHFWRPVDPAHRVDCECKTTETLVKERDGYTYSERHGVCAGCELERVTGKPCTEHRKTEVGNAP